jgi:hypothetical protein
MTTYCQLDVENKGANMSTDFVLGGGIYEFSIGGLFSYNCHSNITSGLIVSGSNIPAWTDVIRAKFCEMPHPMAIPLIMAEALMHTSMMRRECYNQGIKELERKTGIDHDGQVAVATPRQASDTLQDYRGLAVKLSDVNRSFGHTQMLLERSRLQLDFIAKILDPNQGSPFLHSSNLQEASKTILRRAEFMLRSIEYIKSEHQNALQRMQSQEMVISNLIAQDDVGRSIEVALASRKDSSAMRIITFLGTLFLPGTLVAARLTFQSSDLLFHTLFSNLHSKILICDLHLN